MTQNQSPPWPKINLQNHNTTTTASRSKQPQNPATQNAKHPNAIVVLNHHWPPHYHLSLCIFFRVFESKKKKGGEERESKQRKRIKERERKRETEKRYLKYKIFIFYNFVATVSCYVWQFTVTYIPKILTLAPSIEHVFSCLWC